MRHLYLQIYIALVAVLILFGLLVFATWLLLPPSDQRQKLMTGSAAVLSDLLPAKDRPIAETQAALDRLYGQLDVGLSLYSAEGKLLAFAGEVLPAPDLSRRKGGWIHGGGKGPRIVLQLAQGRWLVVRAHREHGASWLWKLALLAIAVALGAYPIVRRITRRLERLQKRVDQLGAGDLSARVEVQGNDEVAKLARSFNHAVDQVESLVKAQRGILAGASHELRTPLTRIRMGVELLAGVDQSELRERISRDIHELDELIEELLLASRLSAGESLESNEAVELLALCAEEGARVGAQVHGTPTTVHGDLRTLRRMLRNLFENAQRHGQGAPVDASVETAAAGMVRIVVSDTGPGVAPAERERIFTPFYRPTGVQEGGSGLGLALVREIARRHGGDARYLPQTDKGSCFEVTISGA